MKLNKCGLALLIAMAAGIVLLSSERCAAQEDIYPALDLMVEAARDYNTGVDNCNESVLTATTVAYMDIQRTLLSDADIGGQYPELFPKIAYMLGWCYYRRFEIGGSALMADSAIQWFQYAADSAVDHKSAFANAMIGEIKLSRIVTTKYQLLLGGPPEGNEAEQLKRRIAEAQSHFDAASRLLDDLPAQQTWAEVKINDARFELARLLRAVGETDSALVRLDEIRYSLPGRQPGDGAVGDAVDFSAYCDANVQLERYLIAADSFPVTDIDPYSADFRFEDRDFRLGAISQANIAVTDAVDQFRAAADQVFAGRPSRRLIPEAEYFHAYAILDSAAMDLLPSRVITVLRSARQSFESFLENVEESGLGTDPRLRQLAAQATQKSILLGIALELGVSDEQLMSFSRDDLKFLIRIAASTVGDNGDSCTAALRRYFELELPRSQPLSNDEALFLEGLVMSLQAEALGATRFATFDSAATFLNAVGGQYRAEAQYIRARASYKAENYQSANTLLLRQIMQPVGSVRALYYYGMNLREWHGEENPKANDTAFAVMLMVKNIVEEAGTPAEYRFLLANANAELDDLGGDGYSLNTDSLQIDGIEFVRCPENLSIDTTGAWDEIVMYETLSEKELIKRQFARKSCEDFSVFGLPKLWLLPSDRSCGQGSILSMANSFAPIPDSVHIEYIWRPRIQYVDIDGNFLDPTYCHAVHMTDTSTVAVDCKDSASHFYVMDVEADLPDAVEVDVMKSGFYPTMELYTSNQPGYKTIKETLAGVVHYVASNQTHSGPFELTQNNDDAYSFNLVAHRNSQEPPPELVEDFKQDRYLRDYAYDSMNDRFLAVSSQLNNGLVSIDSDGNTDTLIIKSRGITVDSAGNIYVADWGSHRVLELDSSLHVNLGLISVRRDGRTDTLTIISRDPLNRAEGITGDSDGNIYIADWGNYRVLVLDSSLHVNPGLISVSRDERTDTLTVVSRDRLNSAEGITVDSDGNIYIADWGNHRVLVLDASGRERFSFGTLGQNQTENSGEPARLMFPNRIVVEEDATRADYPRQRHVLVSDRLGVHKFDARGRYLDSPVRSSQTAGASYEIMLDGYGPESELRVYDLSSDQPRVYTARK